MVLTKKELNELTKPELVKYAADKLKTKIRKAFPKPKIIKIILEVQKKQAAKTAKKTKKKETPPPAPEAPELKEEEIIDEEEEITDDEPEPEPEPESKDDGTYPKNIPNTDMHRPIKGGIMMGGVPEDGLTLTRVTGRTNAKSKDR